MKLKNLVFFIIVIIILIIECLLLRPYGYEFAKTLNTPDYILYTLSMISIVCINYIILFFLKKIFKL